MFYRIRAAASSSSSSILLFTSYNLPGDEEAEQNVQNVSDLFFNPIHCMFVFHFFCLPFESFFFLLCSLGVNTFNLHFFMSYAVALA